MPTSVLGALVVALPALVVAWIVLWRKLRPIFWFAAAMILIGAGYLSATGAASDIYGALASRIAGAGRQAAPAH